MTTPLHRPGDAAEGDGRVATPSQTVGPFFHFGLADNPALGTVAAPGVPGERIRLRVRVLDGPGAPVDDALIEVYQADADGVYGRPGFGGFGRLPTGEDGWCAFDTVRPGPVRDVRGAVEAAHVDACLFARGLLRHICTRIYFEGDPALERDPVLSAVPLERRRTLVASRAAGEPATWEFVIRLQGEGETVFFDF